MTPIVYHELHRLARRYMKLERPGHSLEATALVNEAYMRLVDLRANTLAEPRPFFRRFHPVDAGILVERARRHNLKRGGGVPHVSLEEAVVVGDDQGTDMVALDDAMNALSRIDPRKDSALRYRLHKER